MAALKEISVDGATAVVLLELDNISPLKEVQSSTKGFSPPLSGLGKSLIKPQVGEEIWLTHFECDGIFKSSPKFVFFLLLRSLPLINIASGLLGC